MKRLTLILLALLAVCLPLNALAETVEATSPDGSVLTVTGDAVVTLPADMAVVTLGVRETATDVREAQSTVNEKIAAVRTALTALGIENADISTDSLYIYANYDYSSDDNRIVSYTATNTLRVTVRDVNSAGTAIDAAFGAGANTLENVYFGASDDSDAQDQAYQEAVAAAMHKAEVIAAAAGMQLDTIVSISESQAYNSYDTGNYVRATAAVAEAADGAPTDIQASGVLVNASVTITYRLMSAE